MEPAGRGWLLMSQQPPGRRSHRPELSATHTDTARPLTSSVRQSRFVPIWHPPVSSGCTAALDLVVYLYPCCRDGARAFGLCHWCPSRGRLSCWHHSRGGVTCAPTEFKRSQATAAMWHHFHQPPPKCLRPSNSSGVLNPHPSSPASRGRMGPSRCLWALVRTTNDDLRECDGGQVRSAVRR
jgi:hypothetical protein